MAHLKGLLRVGQWMVPPAGLLSPSLGGWIMEEWVVEWGLGSALENHALQEMVRGIHQGMGEDLRVGIAS